MPCGNRPLVKKWDKSRNLRVIRPSRYEQQDPSVKTYWKKVIQDLENSYKDDKFFESQRDTVQELVPQTIYQRIEKIFNLPKEEKTYAPASETSIVPSGHFYVSKSVMVGEGRPVSGESFFSDYGESNSEDKEEEEEDEGEWSITTTESEQLLESKSRFLSKSIKSRKSISKKSLLRSPSMASKKSRSKSDSKFRSKSKGFTTPSLSDETATTEDEMEVHASSRKGKDVFRRRRGHVHNPFFEMLYCKESETDMIKWKSKYKQKTFEVSASEQFNMKAQILSKKIAKEFYEWYQGLGQVEFKSDIKRPGDIEDLFQVWFDEDASRGLKVDPKILPCVLQSIADYVKEPRLSCSNVLKRQVASDIHAETSPAHTSAFNSSLPHHLKHIPPRNDTKVNWKPVPIPEDLKSMACVWDDIQHLASTKSFVEFLRSRPHLPMPPCLKRIDASSGKKTHLGVPSDLVFGKRDNSESDKSLAFPVSQVEFELKAVLSKLMNH